MKHTLRALLRSGRFLLGTHICACDASMTEAAGLCGFDYLWIDTEHTAIDYRTLQQHLTAASAAGVPAMVRVPWNEEYLAKRVLELGPDGIIFPMIRSAAEAKRAVDACRYPPQGTRGFGPLRAADYGLTACPDFIREEPVCCILQIEHKDAVENIDGILDTPGVDALVLGPCDLSGSMGKLGQPEDAQVQAAISLVIRKCSEHGIPVGVSLGLCPPETLRRWRQRGIRFLSTGNEYSFLQQGAALLRQVFPKEDAQ